VNAQALVLVSERHVAPIVQYYVGSKLVKRSLVVSKILTTDQSARAHERRTQPEAGHFLLDKYSTAGDNCASTGATAEQVAGDTEPSEDVEPDFEIETNMFGEDDY
jgi:hypothetical protein